MFPHQFYMFPHYSTCYCHNSETSPKKLMNCLYCHRCKDNLKLYPSTIVNPRSQPKNYTIHHTLTLSALALIPLNRVSFVWFVRSIPFILCLPCISENNTANVMLEEVFRRRLTVCESNITPSKLIRIYTVRCDGSVLFWPLARIQLNRFVRIIPQLCLILRFTTLQWRN